MFPTQSSGQMPSIVTLQDRSSNEISTMCPRRPTLREESARLGVLGAHPQHETVNERLTGALLDRLKHRIHVLAANDESYRLRESKDRQKRPSQRRQTTD